jgi:hypothetical protein
MRAAFGDAEVRDWEALAGSYSLPDPDDEHVVAAAVLACAETIPARTGRRGPTLAVVEILDILEDRYGSPTLSRTFAAKSRYRSGQVSAKGIFG